ncbi:PIN domain-like protein [Piedraia hortae CBS 480.64]|uniref:PIN domain-like protein n=1 Tax=Piedraia hortae CBS 480.64 TaxID=1314780 RepID=A0A6A7BQT6_9PEZI|nr:PIN domain-like protein [Piedraia hortae CBS 480.64]
MGISGLLPLLKSIHKPSHLRSFQGQTLGVDAYGWLHRGTVACAVELAQGKPTRKHIEFALNRVRMLLHFGVKPFLVFDGDYLPSKAHTEKERAQRRREARKLGLELMKTGRLAQAHAELQKAVDVTPAMARELIDELKKLQVPYIVAPYEADSQLVFLEKSGLVDGIISEDSDLLVFGTKCLLTKMDAHGECVVILRRDFTACREINLAGWTDAEFRTMAMLSGCDYLPGIDKIGLKTAYRLVRKHKTIEKVVRVIQFDGKSKVPKDYLESFKRAERTFLYQWVYCPVDRVLVNLTPVPAELDVADMPYIGKYVEPELAVAVALGQLDPNTKIPLRASVKTPDSKGPKGVTITEFFKRTPLAEKDPNTFTPSPSQQRLLDRRPSSWVATPVSVPSKKRRLCSDTEAGETSRFFPTPDTEDKARKRAKMEVYVEKEVLVPRSPIKTPPKVRGSEEMLVPATPESDERVMKTGLIKADWARFAYR